MFAEGQGGIFAEGQRGIFAEGQRRTSAEGHGDFCRGTEEDSDIQAFWLCLIVLRFPPAHREADFGWKADREVEP
jgi:hypothetical protein